MNKYEIMADELDVAIVKSSTGKTLEERNTLFFEEAAQLFNKHIAGEVTLVDGTTTTIPEL